MLLGDNAHLAPMRWTAAAQAAQPVTAAAPATASLPAPSAATAGDLPGADGDDDTLQLAGLQGKFESLARRIAPAVVAISATTQPVADSANADNTDGDADDAIRQEDVNCDKLQWMLDRTTRMVGAGFIIDADGYILTNEHVVGDSQSIWITTDDKRVFPAIVVGSDPWTDLAVLKIAASTLPTVHFAAYDSVRRGQWSIAMGNPFGLATDGGCCMSVGIVSALNRTLPALSRKENRLYCQLIQTTAQINPGNSGGPLCDLCGDVIGVNSAVILPEKHANGIGFAMPITPQLIAIIQELKQGREIAWSYLGVAVSAPTQHQRRQVGLTGEIGVRVEEVEPDSPAARSHAILANDIIVQVNGQVVGDADLFTRIISSAPPDRPAKLSIYRNSKAVDVAVTLVRRPLPTTAITRQRQRFRWKGMLLGPTPANWNFQPAPRPTGGLMVLAITPDSPFISQHVAQGDIITAVAGQPVDDVTTLQKILSQLPAEQCTLSLAGKADTVVTLRN